MREIGAIETSYRSIQFRSRLEAKWAAFFDRCGWPWSYEPIDLPGWIPDFAIGWRPTFVEVKPYFHADDFVDAVEKITTSGYREPVVLLGAEPRFHDDGEELAIGWLAEYGAHEEAFYCLTDLHIGWTQGNNRLGLCPMYDSWSNVIWPLRGDEARVDDYVRRLGPRPARDIVRDNWAAACNTSQWRARC